MTEEQKTINDAMKVLHAEMDKTLMSFPMWMRFNYLLNTVGKVLEQGKKEADINWDKVNEILTANRSEYDFNVFQRIESAEALAAARADCLASSMDFGVWQVHTCKDCGKEFYMSYREVKFFESKALHIPKRCKNCRAKKKERQQ